jgi:hypothetical protein
MAGRAPSARESFAVGGIGRKRGRGLAQRPEQKKPRRHSHDPNPCSTGFYGSEREVSRLPAARALISLNGRRA